MIRPFALAAAAVGLLAASAPAQSGTPLRFAWEKGAAQRFKVSQTTAVDETAVDEEAKTPVTVKTVTVVTSTKRWTVAGVDKDGTATLELAVVALRQEVTQTVGDDKPTRRVIDSADPEDAKGMAFLDKTVLTATVDARGQLLDAKSDNPAGLDRLRAELPFRLVLPEKAVATNDTWKRTFQVKVPPPHGTGEKYDAVQACTLRGTKEQYAVIGVTAELSVKPGDPAELPAVLPALWAGDVFFDTKAGKYHGAKLTARHEVANHRGEGSKLVYRSDYTEVAEK